MPPKYKSKQAEDWLDDNKTVSRSNRRPKKKAGDHAESVSRDDANAIVAEVFPNQCRVRWVETGEEFLCPYRRASVWGHSGRDLRERAPVAVGDWVVVERVGLHSGIVAAVAERRNRLVRQAPGRDEEVVHVLAANVDLLVIVASADSPKFSPGIVDRFLIAAQREKIQVALVVNKIELCVRGDQRAQVNDQVNDQPWEVYSKLGLPVFEVSAKRGDGLEILVNFLRQKVSVFCGHSGVGKTSLLRKLVGDDFGDVGEVNLVTGKGRHTTSSAILLPAIKSVEMSEGAGIEPSLPTNLIDTPGVRAFSLLGITQPELLEYYPELNQAGCQSQDCTHLGEVGCAATGFSRHDSYRAICESLV